MGSPTNANLSPAETRNINCKKKEICPNHPSETYPVWVASNGGQNVLHPKLHAIILGVTKFGPHKNQFWV